MIEASLEVDGTDAVSPPEPKRRVVTEEKHQKTAWELLLDSKDSPNTLVTSYECLTVQYSTVP